MNRREDLIKKIQPTSVLAGAAWLVGVVVATDALLTPIAFALHQVEGVLAAGVAASICLLGGLAGLLLVVMLPKLDPGYGMLVGMLPRMGLPLLLGMLVYRGAAHLAEAGFIYYLLVFYLVTLAVEAWTAAVQSSHLAQRKQSETAAKS